MNRIHDVSCAILAGGKSLRMGKDKALIFFDGDCLIARIIERVQRISSDVFIVAGNAHRYNMLDIPIVVDIMPGEGPVVGLVTALKNSTKDYLALVACDFPFFNPDLIRRMRELISDFDAVVPRFGDQLHPLMALYAHRSFSVINKEYENGERKMRGVLEKLKIRWMEKDELSEFDPTKTFHNVNTVNDLSRAEKLLKQA